jgi:phosphatidate cytidylyltransferase
VNPTPLMPNALAALAGVFALLAIASITVAILGQLRPKLASKEEARSGKAATGTNEELWLRLRSWWIMALVFALAMVVSRTVSLVFLGFVSFLALKEYLSLIPTRRADRRVLLFAYLAVPLQFYWIGIAWYGMFVIFIPVYMFLFLPLPMLIIGETKGFLRALATLHWGLMTTVFSVSHGAFLLVLPDAVNPAAGGAGLLLFIVILTEANDVAQFIWGKAIGGPKVIPKVSPGKTWAGVVGGVATSALLSAAMAPWLTPMALGPSLIVGGFLGLAGFAGDVTISALKRDLGIKDSGSVLPGHGGILDRLDSLTYTAPLFFHIIRYFYT